MGKTFYFIRHGQTDWNKKHVFQGCNDIPLNDVGVQQAIERAPSLNQFQNLQLFTSPLSRASKTAELMAENSDYEGSIIEIQDIRECESQETAKWLMRQKLKSETLPSFEKLVKNGESPEAFVQRVGSAVESVLEMSGDKTPLIVAHGGTCTGICGYFGCEIIRTPNCCLVEFEWFQDRYYVRVLDDE